MKKLLIPTDFSSTADNAIKAAIQLAKAGSMEIFLMHSFETMGSVYTDYMGANKEYNRELLNEDRDKLNDIKLQLEQENDVSITSVMYAGTFNEAINEAVKENNIDIIVMGTHGASGIKEKLWGSNTSSVIGNCTVPVLVIPNDYKWSTPKNILFATNHFEEDPAILNPVFSFSQMLNATLQLAVFSDEDDADGAEVMEHSRGIHSYEQNLKRKYNSEGLQAHHLSGDDFMETLQECIDKNDFQVVVMVTHQRSFFDRIFHPSLSKKMSYHTNIPLLVLPAKD